MTGVIRDKRTLDDRGEFVVESEYLIDGQVVSREEFDAAFPDQEGVPGGTPSAGYPIRSDAMAVHRDQIPEAVARNRRHGLEVQYERSTGRPILHSQVEKRKLMKIEKFHDKNAYY
jgi:hypothetical protein